MYIHYSHVIKSLCTIYNDSGDTLWIYVLIYFEYYLDNNGASYDCSKVKTCIYAFDINLAKCVHSISTEYTIHQIVTQLESNQYYADG